MRRSRHRSTAKQSMVIFVVFFRSAWSCMTNTGGEEIDMEKVYWRFARRRLKLYFRRLEGPAIASDPILAKYRFTNAYRASDRVSQKLIRIQYDKDYDDSPKEVFFRTMLFKLFNKLETWSMIQEEVGYPEVRKIARIRQLVAHRSKLYSAAYIQASPAGAGVSKAVAHLDLIAEMIEGGLHRKVSKARSLQDVFELLKGVRSFGDFLAYQYAIDLNYSPILDFDENDFVVPGPGALDGISKILPGMDPVKAIRRMTRRAPDNMRGLTLFGRQLHLIDCQNLFCEISKYTRVSHPDIVGVSGRKTIKQEYRPMKAKMPAPFFPPKWKLEV